MLLVTSMWQNQKAFRLIPITNDCPFSEGIYDPASKVLVLMSNIRKQTVHMLPKLNDDGDAIAVKTKRPDGRPPYKEQRVTLETFSEYYISEKDEIESTIEMLAINPEFNYKQYTSPSGLFVPEEKKIILSS